MIFQRLDGTMYDISNYGLTRLYHNIPSSDIEHNTVSIDGRGPIITSSTIGQRTISVDMLFQVADIYDYYLLRDEVNSLFLLEESFYIIFKREPYKRWLVKVADGYKLPPHPKAGTFTVNFRTQNRYAESIATTLDIKEWDIDKWGWNGTIGWDEDLRYRFTTNIFSVNNLGNVKIDPREHQLDIIVKGNFPSHFKLINTTTADAYQYNGPLTSSDELKMSGISTFKNGISSFKNTNKKLISLAPGINNLVIEGGTINSISFNFRFLNK